MTLEEHLRILIGDLALRLAAQAAESDRLRARVEQLESPTKRRPKRESINRLALADREIAPVQ